MSWNLSDDIKVRHLGGGMNTSIRSTCGMKNDGIANHRRDRTLNFCLNRTLVRLSLPTMEMSA
jgi:hypothetical protein